MKLLTNERLHAASMINRWGGWVKRPYSILEHSVIGAAIAQEYFDADPRPFLLHDLHETEIVGDVPTPHKPLYLNSQYHVAVEDFDNRLWAETGVSPDHPVTTEVDRIMAAAEHFEVAVRGDPKYDSMTGHLDVQFARHLINSCAYAGSHTITSFWELWGK